MFDGLCDEAAVGFDDVAYLHFYDSIRALSIESNDVNSHYVVFLGTAPLPAHLRGDAPRSVYGGRDGASHSPTLTSVTKLGSVAYEIGDKGVNRVNRITRLCLVNDQCI